MAINFPTSPTTNDIWTESDRSWKFNGTSWDGLPIPSGSGIITYTPAGTGAVDTVVETKLRERISVTDFGAVGDGATDDTTKIQAAIDYAYSLGGGTVHLPVGRYMVSQIEVPQRVILQGEAAGFSNQYTNSVAAPRGSTLFAITGTNADIVTITMRLETDGTETTLGYSNPDVRHFGGLRDITVWGNRSANAAPTNNDLNSAGDAIKILGARYVQLHNVVAAFAADEGVSMGSFDYGTTSGVIPSNNTMWSNVTAISNFGNGFELYGGDHSFSQLQAGYNGASGIITGTGNSCFNGCYSWNNQVNGVYFLGAGNGTTTMTGCRSYDNESNGFLIGESGQLHLTGCQSKTNGRAGGAGAFSDANRSNFHITSLAQGVLLSGCFSVSESGQDYDEYGFYIDNTTYQVTLSGCRASASATEDYQISDYSKLRSCNDIGTAQPLHSGFVAEGEIDMAGSNIDVNAGKLLNIKGASYNSWATVSTVTTNTLACGSDTMIALNMASPETVNDLTSTVGGIAVHTFRNAGSNAVTFTHNNSKLRNNSGADIVLAASQSISYAFVSGVVWQQI